MQLKKLDGEAVRALPIDIRALLVTTHHQSLFKGTITTWNSKFGIRDGIAVGDIITAGEVNIYEGIIFLNETNGPQGILQREEWYIYRTPPELQGSLATNSIFYRGIDQIRKL